MNTHEIIGHKKQIENLKYLTRMGSIPNSILFTGPSGIGKKIIARRFLTSFFCKSPAPPCLSCSVCSNISQGTFPDFIEIEPNDKGTIPIGSEEKMEIGSVRWLIDRLTKKSIYGKTGIIIDGFDKITEEGQNALLKTTEEPSVDAYFILLSSNRARILPTILSRCSEIKFYPLSSLEINEILKIKNLPSQDSDLISLISGGSVETALILTDQGVLDDIFQLCRRIASFRKPEALFNADTASLQKKIGLNKLLDIIITIFRQNLMSQLYNNSDVDPVFKEFFIDDTEYISGIIKILLALKKSESQNINVKFALKGMLHALNSGRADNMPFVKYYTSVPGGE